MSIHAFDVLKKRAHKRSPRVLIVIENMSYTYDTRMRKIAKSLARSGWEVSVICPRYPGDPFQQNGNHIRVVFYPSIHHIPGVIGHLVEYAWSFLMISLLSFVNFIARRFDVVHVCNPPDIFFPLGWVFRPLGCRFIFDQHDLCPELWNIRYGKWPVFRKLIVAAEKATIATANYIFVTSETARRRMLARTKASQNRVTLVLNGPDLQNFPVNSQNSSIMNKKPMQVGTTVGYVGDMNPQDGIENLILAADFIYHAMGRKDIHFVCIGDGSVFNDCKKQVEELGLEVIMNFVGRLPPSQCRELLAKCDICVQPDPKNAFTDSCVMVKSLEYMALSKPIVAFDLEETQRTCDNAALYATNNSIEMFAHKIVKLADNAKLRSELGDRGRQRIEKQLAWSFTVQPLLDTYAHISQEMGNRLASSSCGCDPL